MEREPDISALFFTSLISINYPFNTPNWSPTYYATHILLWAHRLAFSSNHLSHCKENVIAISQLSTFLISSGFFWRVAWNWPALGNTCLAMDSQLSKSLISSYPIVKKWADLSTSNDLSNHYSRTIWNSSIWKRHHSAGEQSLHLQLCHHGHPFPFCRLQLAAHCLSL